MAATALNFLTAALAQTSPTADATASGTAGQTDGVAGLFQSVLASAVTRATGPRPCGRRRVGPVAARIAVDRGRDAAIR